VQFLGSRGEGGPENTYVPAGATAQANADFGSSAADDDIPF
jgi:hypothetical protein